MQALRCLIYDNEVHSLPAWNNHENVAMGLLRYWRAFLRYLSQKTIKTFVLSLLVISHLHVSEGVRWAPNGQPKDTSVVVGGQAKFNCTVEDLGNAQYFWNMGSSTIFLNGQQNTALQGFDWSRYRIEGRNNLVIDNVQESDESSFACVIFGFDQVQVHLTVWVPPGPPVISQNYSGQLVENTVISLTCSSQGGKPAPTVRWLRNGQPVNSAKDSSSSSQIVVDVSRQDHSANFSCLVYNEANQNSPLISTRILNVQYSPSIHFEPDYSPYKVKLNSPVSLRCVIDANPPAQRPQWRKNGSPIAVSGETLTFSAIQKSDSGEYTCSTSNLIQNQVKSASSSVSIDVIYAPIVTTQPILVANISTQVDMTCSVDANPPVTSIRWQKLDDNPIYATGPNFVFTASKRYIGNYSCTASSQLEPSGSPIEQVQSKGYTQLRIQYGPGQASISPTSSVLVGQPIMLTCTVDDPGYPNPNYEWRKAGSSQILQSTTSPVYRINSATLSDNGNYSCLPRNLMGRGTRATILVDVNSAPRFIKSTPNMDNFTVPINQSNLFLQHKIEGRPLPAVQWFKDGVPLSVMPKLFRIETTNSLAEYKYNVTSTVTFVGSDRNGQNSLRIEDMGNYTCQVMSSASTDTVSKSVFLSIEFKPKTSATMTRVAADADVMEEATLTCDIQSNPAPLFSWYRMVPGQNQRLYNGSKITIISQNDGIAKYMSLLKIRNTSQGDFGQYLCEVYNARGQTSKTITLSPKDKPDSPTNLGSFSKTWESVNLRWVPGFNGGFDQTFFIHISSIYGERKEEVYPHASYTFNVTRLMPQTSYTFHVYGRNDRGQGKNSAGFTAQTEVLVFPPLKEIPEYKVEERSLTIPNDLNQSYCLRVEVSKDSGKVWTTAESCVPPSGKGVPLNLQTATNVNVSVCLVYRPEVCGEPVISKIHQASAPDLSAGQVVIIGCVCAAILIILLIILIVILCRRRQRNKNYQQQQDPHSPRTVQQGNGVIPQKQPQRPYDNSAGMVPIATIGQGHGSHSNLGTLTRTNNYPGSGPQPSLALSNMSYGLQLDNRNGYPSQFHFNVDTSYDSQNYDSQYELEMNRRNANLSGDPYFEKQGDMSFNGSPRTPIKDPQQFINLPEETHKREGGGSMGSGNESGYSTPDPAKPKKHFTLKPYLLPALQTLKRPITPKPQNTRQTNPDMVPYSHNPPGHTCGLPCCNEELQIQLRVKRNRGPRTCIGIQHVDEILADNFTFRGGKVSKDRPVLENGFFSIQQKKEAQHGAIPKFASVSKGMTKKDDLGRHNFLKGREITLPEAKDPDATNKLYLEDFYTGESDDLLDVTSNKDIEYYMTERNPDNPDKGVPYSQKEIDTKDSYPWEIVLEVKSKTSGSEKTDDTSSSNYYEVLNYPDSIQSSENEKNISESLTLKRVKKFPIAKPLPEVPPKVPLQNLFNHPPLPKEEAEKSSERSFSTFKQNSTCSDKTINKYNTYSTLYSHQSEKRKLEHPQHWSLDRSYTGQKWRMDARDIDFQAPIPQTLATGKENLQNPKHNGAFENKTIDSQISKPEFQETEMPAAQEAAVANSDGSDSPKHTFEGRKLHSPTFKRKSEAPNTDAQAASNDGSESPKHTFEKKIQSPTFKRKVKDKKKNQFERTERENQDFNIMLNSELVKLKKFFAQDDDDDTASQRNGHCNPAYMKDGRQIKDSPVTLIL